jgi:hypothetical protein
MITEAALSMNFTTNVVTNATSDFCFTCYTCIHERTSRVQRYSVPAQLHIAA